MRRGTNPMLAAVLAVAAIAVPAAARPSSRAPVPGVTASPDVALPAWERAARGRSAPEAAPPDGRPAEEPLDAICEQLGTAHLPDGPCESWVSRYREHPNAQAEGIVVAPGGGRVFVTGSVEGAGGFPDLDFLTLAYDAASGDVLWSRTYDGPGLYDTPVPLRPIALSPDAATVYVTGGSFTGDERNGEFATIAYDAATGAERWRSIWNGEGSRLDFAYHVIPSPDGETVYVGGDSGEPIGGFTYYDSAVLALDARTGEVRWETLYRDPVGENDFADGLALSPDGRRLYLTMGSFEACDACPGHIDMQSVTVAYGTTGDERGDVVWREVHRGAFDAPDRPRDTALTPDGSSLVVATIANIPGKSFDFGVLAHDTATGERTWYTTWGGGGVEMVNDVAVSPDGRTVFVTGEGDRTDGVGVTNEDFTTLALDVSTGAQRWAVQDSFDSQWWNNQPDVARGVAVTADGTTVVVTGSSVGANHDDYWTIAYGADDGERLWSVRLDHQRDVDRPQALAVDGTRVYVAGSGTAFRPEAGTWMTDLVTVAYPLVRPPLTTRS